MKTVREIKRVHAIPPTRAGAGVHLHCAFGFHQAKFSDPFLPLDDFYSDKPGHFAAGFPWHPYRGLETITYVLNGGELSSGAGPGLILYFI
ncbi:pirin family protein [candidate division FCPU426 bacterium]|nr:pirin family protein [candidate division FCPU426 bacterium]